MTQASEDLLHLRPRPHADSAGRVLDGEAVVVTPADSKMHTMNEVGTWLWERFDGRRTVAEVIGELVAEFEVDEEIATRDVVSFVRLLMEKGVLEAAQQQS